MGGSLERTLNDNDIIPRLRREDFIFICETHSRKSWKLELAKQFSIHRKDRENGKAGGVAWLWAKEHDANVKVLECDIRSILILEVDFRDRGGCRLFLVGVYFPPAGPSTSSTAAVLERTDISQRLPVLLTQLSQCGSVLVVGDTNARVGDACDGKLHEFDNYDVFVSDESDAVDGTGLVTKFREPNADKIINTNGEEILSWARGAGLWILNGRCIPNTCTYFAVQGSSNCDTWLGSDDILEAAVDGFVSDPLLQSDHAILKLRLQFLLRPRQQDCVLDFVRSQTFKPSPWKMRRAPIQRTLEDGLLLQHLSDEYLQNSDIQAASQAMQNILDSGRAENGAMVENCVAGYFHAVEELSVVSWQSTQLRVANATKFYRTLNSGPVQLAEAQFFRCKRAWRRERDRNNIDREKDTRLKMLAAKKLVCRLRQKERRKHQRGEWRAIAALGDREKAEAMWKKLKTRKLEEVGVGTVEMLEAGVREVAQVGFPHDEVSSLAWARDFEMFTHDPEPIPDCIMDSTDLWKLNFGKATGEDGWCEEFLMLFKKMGGCAFADLKNALRLMAMYARIPRYQRGSLIKPVLKPGKKGATHNEYRKLSMMSVLRKKLEKIGSLLMRPYWQAGAYQAGFRKGKRASSRIFILLAMVAKTLWPLQQQSVQTKLECGILFVDFEQFFDTLRPERLFHKMLHAGVPRSVIRLWKELFRTHFVKICFAGTVGKPIKVLVGVPQGSAWSPELATLYVDVGLAQALEKVQVGTINLNGHTVHMLMYADDLLTASNCERGLQEQFDQIEKTSEEDGLRISYKKTVVAVFRRPGEAVNKWSCMEPEVKSWNAMNPR